MNEPARERKGRKRRALLALGASTILSLAFAELFCRVRCGAPLRERLPLLEVRASRTRGYEMVPDRDHYTYEQPVHVNHLGLRGRDLPQKVAGEWRILCLGDSLTFGQGVSEEETIPALLERALSPGASAAGRTVRVVNGGLRGYATAHELALLEELLPTIQPDLVLLLWYVNDLERPDMQRQCESLLRSGPVAFDTGVRMEGWALSSWRCKQVFRSSALLMKLHDLWTAKAVPAVTDQGIRSGLDFFDRDLENFLRLSREREFDFVMAQIPDSAALLGSTPWDLIVQKTREHARAGGALVIGLLEELRDLRASSGRLPVLPYDGHYCGAANAVMARKLASALSERLPKPH